MIHGLTELLKEGLLARLEIVNVDVDPEVAATLSIRTLPWYRIGPFDLSGTMSKAELSEWVDYAAQGQGWATYYSHLLENRRLFEVVARIQAAPGSLVDLLNLLPDLETPMSVRIGISAVIEDLAGSVALRAAVPELEQLTLSELPQARGDACHFLSLAGDTAAIPVAQRLLDDEDPDVRDIAAETLVILGDDSQSTDKASTTPP